MRKLLFTAGLLTITVAADANQRGKFYEWVDEEGVTHYSDSIPAQYSDLDKQVVNQHGMTLEEIEGRKTAEELEQERREAELRVQRELQLRADRTLLATYLNVDEIRMHRDRRVELFQAQSRVTELFLKNLETRLQRLEREASRYQPYSADPEAPMVDPGLIDEINDTKSTIQRHEANLVKFQQEEQTIKNRFDGDIARFKTLKGMH